MYHLQKKKRDDGGLPPPTLSLVFTQEFLTRILSQVTGGLSGLPQATGHGWPVTTHNLYLIDAIQVIYI
jgi:hypothetical protein